jgi:hypothetical protein
MGYGKVLKPYSIKVCFGMALLFGLSKVIGAYALFNPLGTYSRFLVFRVSQFATNRNP